MSGAVQSVVMQGRLYVGGGWAGDDNDNNYTVVEFDINSRRWTTLPLYEASFFAMTATSTQLVLVGGEGEHGASKVLGVWGPDRNEWSHPYPEMPTGRSSCSAVVSNEWLVVAGGSLGGNKSSCVEVLNTDSKQWYTGPPTPVAWSHMKTAVVGGMGYFMGGEQTRPAAKKVYRLCFQTLASHITSQASSVANREIWKEISGLQLSKSAPLSISGSLLAVGGRNKDGRAVTAIHLYQPDSGEWVKVGDLPSPRATCTCAMITDREVLVTGGDDGHQTLKRVDLALIA